MARRSALLARGSVLGMLMLALGLMAVLRPGSQRTIRADPDDVASIENTIENGIRLLGEGCTESNHADLRSIKRQLEAYWSGERPTIPATVMARADVYRDHYSTAQPNESLDLRQSAATDLARGDIDANQATVIAEYERPTPNWSPEWSILEERRSDLDSCQEAYGSPDQSVDFGLDPIAFHSVRINGNEAIVEVTVNVWTDYHHTPTRRRTSRDETFHLSKQQDGSWRITYERWLPGPF